MKELIAKFRLGTAVFLIVANFRFRTAMFGLLIEIINNYLN